jgi:hypothetical protein
MRWRDPGMREVTRAHGYVFDLSIYQPSSLVPAVVADQQVGRRESQR